MNPVFLDTVGLLALWDQNDQWHSAANQAYAQLAAARRPMITTTYILLECGNAAARRPYRASVDRLRTSLEAAGSLVIPTEEDWRQAWTDYAQSQAGQAGIVDHVSLLVMRRLGLTEAFTNDRHFRTAGFVTLF